MYYFFWAGNVERLDMFFKLSRFTVFWYTFGLPLFLLKGELKAPLYVLGLNLSQLPRGNYEVLQSF